MWIIAALAQPVLGIPQNRRGTAVTEFALVAPLLLIILLGIIGYGGFFWRAHSLQQAANDGARAAIAGLTATERQSLAQSTVNADLTALAGLQPSRATTNVQESGDTLTVQLSYDASNDTIFKLGIVPMPSPVISRKAAIKLGGL